MFGIGGFELFIILIFGFLIFGPDKLPEIAKTVGRGIARFREAQQEMNDTLGGEKIFDPNNPDEPFKDPVEVLDRLAQKQEEKRAAKEAASTSSAQSGSAAAAGASTAGAVAESESAAGASEAVPASGSGAGDTAEEAPAQQESFTERKARYERERAARKAAEREAAEAASEAESPNGNSADVAASPAEGGDA